MNIKNIIKGKESYIMKTMKAKLTLFIALFALISVLTPNVKAQAAVTQPAAPTGLDLQLSDLNKKSSTKNTFRLIWNFDATLPYNTYNTIDYYGHEVVIQTLKGKNIQTIDTLSYSGYGQIDANNTGYLDAGDKEAIDVKNKKLASQGFKFKVRSYVFDEAGQRVYSQWSKEKVIIPRATITKKAMSGSNVKITWSKVSGAKSYTVYISTNGKKYKKAASSNGTSAIVKKLKRYQTYYIYVQANGVKYKKKKYNSTKAKDLSKGVDSFYIYTTYVR